MAPESHPAKQPPVPNTAGRTVLIVDDEFLIRWSLRSRLADAGFAVVEAPDLKSARVALREPVDVVLLDLRLPDGDGMHFLDECRARRPNLPIIVMTAHGTEETKADAMWRGAFALVHKPFDLDQVVRLAQTAISS